MTTETTLREEQASIERLRLVDDLTRAEIARLEAIRRELEKIERKRAKRNS